MLNKIIILALSVAAFSSCSTAYKSTQTPDDVYYSPTRPAPAYVDREETRDEIADNYNNNNNEDREIVMGIRDPRWRSLNDPFAYSIGYGKGYYGTSFYNNYYNPYSYGFNNSPYNYCYNTWNNNYGYYYNPYYYPHPIYTPVIVTYQPSIVTRPRMVNLNTYNGYNTNNQPRYNNSNSPTNTNRNYNNTNRSSRVGNVVRRVLTPATSSGRSNPDDNNSRSYTPSSSNRSSSPGSSSSGSSSSGSSSGGVSRPGRGG